MKKSMICQIFSCLILLCFSLFAYLEKQNMLTKMRIALPKLAKEIKLLEEENSRLLFEIELFENPQNLVSLASDNKFAHLKHPLTKDIVSLQEGIALKVLSKEEPIVSSVQPKLTLAVGAK